MIAAIVFSGDSKAIVDAYNLQKLAAKQASYWQDDATIAVRESIKAFYIEQQAYRCCYCYRQILTDHKRAWDAEHIAPKSLYAQFVFEPLNLAVSCIDCNLSKSDENVMSSKAVVSYPGTSAAFSIVHPHFDDLSDHIGIFMDRIYVARSRKGEETIRVCRLMRYAYEYVDWDSDLAGNEALADKLDEMLTERDEAKLDNLKIELLMIAQVQVSRTLLNKKV